MRLNQSVHEKCFAIVKGKTSGEKEQDIFSSLKIVFLHDVRAAILVSQSNEKAAVLVSQTSHVGVELFSYVNAFFCSNKFAQM